MIQKRKKWILYSFLILLVATMVIAPDSKPIAGFVFLDNGTVAHNASIKLYINETTDGLCETIVDIYTGTDGSFATNMNNLKKSSNKAQGCNWNLGDNRPIWFQANGSTIVNSDRSEGIVNTSNTTVTDGSGLQYITNGTMPDRTIPVVTLILPVNNTNSSNGTVVFEYNVSDASPIANCSLIFNDVINLTNTSVTANTTQDFTPPVMGDGMYNWSVHCVDEQGNQGNSSVRLLNVTKIGDLSLSQITPAGDTSVEQYQFFEFTTQITCTGGTCGDVNASLDPISPGNEDGLLSEDASWDDLSFMALVRQFLRGFLGGNLITGMATGALVPENSGTPFWTNTSNPGNYSTFSCLENMVDGSSCNVTWWVNASGGVGTIAEFFAFANSTENDGVSNETIHFNITITESIPPAVTALIPVAATNFNVSTTIEIAANVTDNTNVSIVLANITHPNGTITQLTLTNNTLAGEKYNTTFTIPAQIGTFTVQIIANDTENNINSTETTNFIAVDSIFPSVTDLRPVSNASFNVSDIVEIAANVSDDVSVDIVLANITLPNGSITQLTLTNGTGYANKYNLSFTIPTLLGQYNVTFIANDTSNNVNKTETTFFVGFDGDSPLFSSILESPTDPATYSAGAFYQFNVTVTDNIALDTIFIEFNGTNYTAEVQSSGLEYFFNRTDLAAGTYGYTWYANDTSGNDNSTAQTYTVNRAASAVNTTLDGTDGDITVEVNSAVNLTGERITGEGNIELLQNGTVINSGGTLLSNLTTFSTLGQFNITTSYTQTQNYSGSQEQHILTVQDTLVPNVTNLNTTPTAINQTQPTQINVTVIDNFQISVVQVQITYPNGSAINQTTTNFSSEYSATFTTTLFDPPGTYTALIYANDTSGNMNATTSTTFTVSDVTPPNVTAPIPFSNASESKVFNVSNLIEIAANVTDNYLVDTVLANLTYPNGSSITITLSNGTSYANKFNTSFEMPPLLGAYNITFIANDSSNNINGTTEVNFTVQDVVAPNVTTLNTTPGAINQTQSTQINVTVLDDVSVSVAIAQITYPNGTAVNQTMTNFSSEYSTTFTTTLFDPIGTYTVLIYANDTSNNMNSTTSTTFTVSDVTPPNVTDVSATPSTINQPESTQINATVTDNIAVDSVIAQFTYPNGTVENQTMTNTSSRYSVTFTTAISYPTGTYTVLIFANDSSGNLNNTESVNFTVSDGTPPNVTSLLPTNGSVFNVSNVIELGANVTDNIGVDVVFANLTYPNGTSVNVTFSNNTEFSKYNASFTLPTVPGLYNMTIIANDTDNNINNTELVFFTVNDVIPPSVRIVNPLTGTNFVEDAEVLITQISSDDVAIDTALVNVTAPNSSVFQLTLGYLSGDDIYNVTFTHTGTTGTYTILAIVNDTSNNVNNTVTRTFTVQSGDVPFVSLTSPPNNNASSNTNMRFECNVTDTTGLVNLTLYHNISGSFIANQTLNISGTSNSTNFTVTGIAEGVYAWNCFGADTDNNTKFAGSNFTFTVDSTVPNVTNIAPAASTEFNISTDIVINVTVLDSFTVDTVLANITYPNGSLTLLTLLDSDGDNAYNGTFSIPALNGTYNITYLVNDSANNRNDTTTTNFSAVNSTNSSSSEDSGSSSGGSSGGGSGGSSGGGGSSGCVDGYESVNGVCVKTDTGPPSPYTDSDSSSDSSGGSEAVEEESSAAQEDSSELEGEADLGAPQEVGGRAFVGKAFFTQVQELTRDLSMVYFIVLGALVLLGLLIFVWKEHRKKARVTVSCLDVIETGRTLYVVVSARAGNKPSEITFWGLISARAGMFKRKCPAPSSRKDMYVLDLERGEERSVTIPIQIPENFAPGKYSVIVCGNIKVSRKNYALNIHHGFSVISTTSSTSPTLASRSRRSKGAKNRTTSRVMSLFTRREESGGSKGGRVARRRYSDLSRKRAASKKPGLMRFMTLRTPRMVGRSNASRASKTLRASRTQDASEGMFGLGGKVRAKFQSKLKEQQAKNEEELTKLDQERTRRLVREEVKKKRKLRKAVLRKIKIEEEIRETLQENELIESAINFEFMEKAERRKVKQLHAYHKLRWKILKRSPENYLLSLLEKREGVDEMIGELEAAAVKEREQEQWGEYAERALSTRRVGRRIRSRPHRHTRNHKHHRTHSRKHKPAHGKKRPAKRSRARKK